MKTGDLQSRWVAFEKFVRHVCSTWTLLVLAVDQGWGGRYSLKVAESFVDWLLLLFYEGFIKGKELNIVPEELADKLAEKLEELFSVEIDDDSDIEVSRILSTLYSTCVKGDFSFGEDIIATTKASSYHGIKNQHFCLGSSDKSSDESSDESSEESSEESSQMRNKVTHSYETIDKDVDGWITVPVKRK